MMHKTAAKYYLSSILTTLNNFNWYGFPLLFIKKEIVIKIKNKSSFYVSNFMDIWTLKEVIVDDQYRTKKMINKKDVVIDIGAAIGDFSILAAQKAKKVIAYECNAERVRLMKKNLKINKVINVLLKDTKAKSLAQILKGIERCNFLKIDCEGCEYDIFNNASARDLDKIEFIAMEAHQFNQKMKKQYQDLLTVLKKHKFEIEIVPNQVHDYICFVFASKQK